MVYILFSACATNCKTCSTKGSGKCDTNGCKSGYRLKDDFTACEGKLNSVINHN